MLEHVAAQRTAQEGIAALAVADLRRAWATLDPTDPPAATRAAIAAAVDTTAAYGDLAGLVAADFYDELRALAAPPGRFSATPAGPVPLGQVEAATRWAVGPLWSSEPDGDAALRRLSGSVRRLSLQPGRSTVWEASRSEGVRYAVVPQIDACSWCLMLASRGAVYHSSQTARVSTTLGREAEYHDSCRCVIAPVWNDRDLPQINRDLAAEWRQTTAGERDQLAAWRRHIAASREPAAA